MAGAWYQEQLDGLNINGRQMDGGGKVTLTAADIPVDDRGTPLDAALEGLTPIYLTQAEYDALTAAGTVLPGREYRILEAEDGA